MAENTATPGYTQPLYPAQHDAAAYGGYQQYPNYPQGYASQGYGYAYNYPATAYPGYEYNAHYQQYALPQSAQPPLPPSDAEPTPPGDGGTETTPPLPTDGKPSPSAPAAQAQPAAQQPPQYWNQGYDLYGQQAYVYPANGYYPYPAPGYDQSTWQAMPQQPAAAPSPYPASSYSAAAQPQYNASSSAAPPAPAPASTSVSEAAAPAKAIAAAAGTRPSGANAMPLGHSHRWAGAKNGPTNQAATGITIKPNLPRGKPASTAKPAYFTTSGPTSTSIDDKTKAARPAPAAASAAADAGRKGWPPSLKAYVLRYFEQYGGSLTEAHKQDLKQMIQDAEAKGELWTRDWDRTPLPRLDKSAARAANASATAAAAAKHRWGPPANVPARTSTPLGKRARATEAARAAKVAAGKNRKLKRPAVSSSSSEEEQEAPVDNRERARRQQRAGRFGNGVAPNLHPEAPKGGSAAGKARKRLLAVLAEAEPDEADWDAAIIKGTCRELEKGYFRLTSAPDPATVRPEPVLWRAYERLVALLADGSKNYFYALDQFKGMRQDLTVQHLQSELTVKVYEGHARAALEYGDTAEFNQCQTQLDVLYRKGLPGATREFMAYRILYQTVHARLGESHALLKTLKSLTPEDYQHPAVAHAMSVRQAVAMCDFVRFFRLYTACPGLGRCLMDLHVPKMRHQGVEALAKACQPSLPVARVALLLGFLSRGGQTQQGGGAVLAGCSRPACECGKNAGEDDEEDAIEDCLSWLAASNAVITGKDAASSILDSKQSSGHMVIPEDTSAVAHGDANLNIDDFLSRTMCS